MVTATRTCRYNNGVETEIAIAAAWQTRLQADRRHCD